MRSGFGFRDERSNRAYDATRIGEDPMNIILDNNAQEQVNRLRIDLAQAVIDMAEVKTDDIDIRQAKERSIEGLRRIKTTLDGLGIQHEKTRRCANGRT